MLFYNVVLQLVMEMVIVLNENKAFNKVYTNGLLKSLQTGLFFSIEKIEAY